MVAADFIRSAELSAPLLAKPSVGLGDRVLQSAQAVMTELGSNTNLGILLLAAPLCQAALISRPDDLLASVKAVLEGSTQQDADLVFQAIRLMQPAGLGHSEQHDVAARPTVTLLEAMRYAALRDRIAYQYANQYEDIFGRGVPRLNSYRHHWRGAAEEWRTVDCYLGLLAALPDSHVARKHGSATAEWLRARAQRVESRFKACENRASAMSLLSDFDKELKKSGINPGTTADLTVASLLARRLGVRT
jgi:triphosphoribosyl-dephospho-CoA synthase